MFGDVAFAQAPFAALGGATYALDVSESAVANNAQSALVDYVSTTEESAAGSDSFSAGVAFVGTIEESATAAALTSVIAVLGAMIEERATAYDDVSAVKEVNARPDGIQLYVNIGNVLIWAVIDDSQSANWQNISNVQGSGWTVIDDEQTPGWTNIPS